MCLKEEVARALAVTGVKCREFSAVEAEESYKLLGRLFALPGHRPLWERLAGALGVRDANAWKRIAEWRTGSVNMLVTQGDTLGAYRFELAADLILVVGECYGFVFYVWDGDLDWVLAFNDHEFVIGCGRVVDWVAGVGDD